MRTDKIEDRIFSIIQMMVSLTEVLYRSKINRKVASAEYDNVLVIGNGPGLVRDLGSFEITRKTAVIACNFYLLNNEMIKPTHYVLLDDRYFGNSRNLSIGSEASEKLLAKKISMLIAKMNALVYPITLYVPHRNLRFIRGQFENRFITIQSINTSNLKGPSGFVSRFIKFQFGFPEPQTVLIASTIIGTYLASKVYLVGAQSSWLKNLKVDSSNRVQTSLEHDNDESLIIDYDSLTSMLRSQLRVFSAYEMIEKYCSKYDITILNLTKDSYIDSIEKGKL